ncbi:hypothetical protein ASAP_2168 [Asaia bogorensis]|uniref:Uncharacterized protein n=1 Tax=Asaia bogorensis TaxID=91915 RepID=A0A060QHR1_9PROT|nr:hypothetical protein ASAP_2168 [Asaia bogorensis]
MGRTAGAKPRLGATAACLFSEATASVQYDARLDPHAAVTKREETE